MTLPALGGLEWRTTRTGVTKVPMATKNGLCYVGGSLCTGRHGRKIRTDMNQRLAFAFSVDFSSHIFMR